MRVCKLLYMSLCICAPSVRCCQNFDNAPLATLDAADHNDDAALHANPH